MTKTQEMTKYELVLIVDAHLTAEQKDSTLKEVAETIQQVGGKVINSQVWFDKQKFTFEIQKKTEGTYYLINFEGGADVDLNIQPKLKLNEKVLRSLTIKVE